MGKKIFLLLLSFSAIFSLAGVISRFSAQQASNVSFVAHAEDDEEEDDEEHEESSKDDEQSSASSSSSKPSVTTTQSVVNRSVVTQEVTVDRRTDSDGDGKLDDEDAYPTINDNLIVRDDNRNGIVDEYERQE